MFCARRGSWALNRWLSVRPYMSARERVSRSERARAGGGEQGRPAQEKSGDVPSFFTDRNEGVTSETLTNGTVLDFSEKTKHFISFSKM
jgi:hypothetical protein